MEYMDQPPAIVAQVRPNLLIEDIDQAIVDRLGYTPDEAKGRSVWDFMTEQDRTLALQRAQAQPSASQQISFITVIGHQKDGHVTVSQI
jgi:PAS domain S-box-containing protein